MKVSGKPNKVLTMHMQDMKVTWFHISAAVVVFGIYLHEKTTRPAENVFVPADQEDPKLYI